MLNLCLCCTVIRQSCNLHTFIRTGQPVLKIGARGIRGFVINLYEIRIKRISPKILKLLCLLTITGKVVMARAVYLYGGGLYTERNVHSFQIFDFRRYGIRCYTEIVRILNFKLYLRNRIRNGTTRIRVTG